MIHETENFFVIYFNHNTPVRKFSLAKPQNFLPSTVPSFMIKETEMPSNSLGTLTNRKHSIPKNSKIPNSAVGKNKLSYFY